MFDIEQYQLVKTAKQLKKVFPFPPAKIYLDSEIDRINDDFRRFISLCSFAIISSLGGEGVKVSPRGGSPGFIHVLDDNWILLPDYKGNNKIETFVNLIEQPDVGLICFVNGIEFTLRMTGIAHITNDKSLLEIAEHKGRVPKIGVLVNVDKAYLHCGNSVRKARLWDNQSYFSTDDMPSISTMLKSILGEKEIDIKAVNDYVESRLKESELAASN